MAFKIMHDPIEVALAINGGTSVVNTDRFVQRPVGAVARRHADNSYVSGRLRPAMRNRDDGQFYLRPLSDLNVTKLHTGGFSKAGAGPIDLIVPPQPITQWSAWAPAMSICRPAAPACSARKPRSRFTRQSCS